MNGFNAYRLTRFLQLAVLFSIVSINGMGQCLNGPTIRLSSTSGSTCGATSITVSGNLFGGSATRVTITENGHGSVSPVLVTSSPFTFKYTPKSSDAGKTVLITLTTNNPDGSPCIAANAVYTLKVNTAQAIPLIGTITGPTCSLATGSVILNGLPSAGTWILTRLPGGSTTSGTGSTTTISGLAPGTYTFTVTNSDGCTSLNSGNVVINNQPSRPAVPVQITECTPGSARAVVRVVSPVGTGLVYNIDGGPFQSGTSFANIIDGNHIITVRNTSGCIASGAAFQVSCGCSDPHVITLSSTSGNTCGTTPVVISGNTYGGSATGVTLTVNGLGAVSPVTAYISPFSFTYLPAAGDAGRSVIVTITTINTLSATCVPATAEYTLIVNNKPEPPTVGTINQPTCINPAGSVLINGLPETGTWILTRYPGTVTWAGSGNSTIITGLPEGIYNYSVITSAGCYSELSANVVIEAPLGAPTLIITDPPPVCIPNTADLTAPSVTTGSTQGLIFTYWLNPAATIPCPAPSRTGAGTYFIKGTASSGCFDIGLVTVIENSFSTTNAGLGGSECDLNFLLNAIAGTGTGTWTKTNGPGAVTFTPGPNLANATVTVSEYGTYSFTWTEISGSCSASSAISVDFNRPSFARAGPDQELEYISDISLSAEPANENETGVWSVITGTGEILDPDLANTSVSGLSFGENKFLWTITGGQCPSTSDTVAVIVQEQEVPTLITPNLDGRNDYFILRGLDASGKTEVTIFDRRGALKYESHDYDNSWDGVDLNGNPLPDDTYFFSIKSGSGKSNRGYIVIRR